MELTKHEQIINLITAIREVDSEVTISLYNKPYSIVFHNILSVIYPIAEMWMDNEGYIISKIDDRWYNIKGRIRTDLDKYKKL